MQSKCPCVDCKERSVTCHSNCEKYKSWRKELDQLNATLRAKKLGSYDEGYEKRNNQQLKRKA